MSLEQGELKRLRNAVAERVYQLSDKKPIQQNLFRALYSALKTRYQVASYKDVPKPYLQDAVQFIQKWKE